MDTGTLTLGTGVLKDVNGERVLKTCTYKWKYYNEGLDTFEIRTEKMVGQCLVFKRQDFISDSELNYLKEEQRKEVQEPEKGLFRY